MNFVMFCLGAFSLAIGLVVMPYVNMLRNAFKSRKKRKSTPDCAIMEHNIEVIVKELNELKEQMSNVAQNSYRREQNRKSNVRREVRDYLKELRDEK